jgi:hypothetical protein
VRGAASSAEAAQSMVEDCRRLETPSREEAEEGKDDDDDDDQQDDGEGAPPFVGTLFRRKRRLACVAAGSAPSKSSTDAPELCGPGRTGAGPRPRSLAARTF